MTRTEYRRSVQQLASWELGDPYHDAVSDLCCPDRSCCHPELLADELTRRRFCAAMRENDTDTVRLLVVGFIAAYIRVYFPALPGATG